MELSKQPGISTHRKTRRVAQDSPNHLVYFCVTAKATTVESEWEIETLTVLPPAAVCASPENFTTGPDSEFKISMSFMLAPAPLLGTDKALKTAPFAAHRPANEASESGALEQ